MGNIVHNHLEEYHQFPLANRVWCFNYVFKTNLVLLISFLVLFCPISSHSFALG
jgi:hypothetical protein